MGWTGAAVTTAPREEVGVFARSALNKHCHKHFTAIMAGKNQREAREQWRLAYSLMNSHFASIQPE
jgi:hypothetical protein